MVSASVQKLKILANFVIADKAGFALNGPENNHKTHVLKSHLNKVAGRQACSFIKKSLQHTYFPVNIAKFLKNLF